MAEMRAELVLLPMPGNEMLAAALAAQLGCPSRPVTLHRFPDGESLVTLADDLAGRDAVIVCTLNDPDAKLAPLLFAADTARDLGARRVGLLAPYLAYMRQDTRFHAGEAVTSRTFAAVLSCHIDFLATVDPHLHRYHALAEIYPIPTQLISAAPSVADWIARNIERPLLIGPDSESAQWIEATASLIGAPFTVLEKTRFGDTEVRVSVPNVDAWRTCTPVLLDDIMSSGRTMAAAAIRLLESGLPAPVCIGVHAILPNDALSRLRASGVGRVVSCNTVGSETNAIDLAAPMADALRHWVASANIS